MVGQYIIVRTTNF